MKKQKTDTISIYGYLLKTAAGLHVIFDSPRFPESEEKRALGAGLGSVLSFPGQIPDRLGKKSRAQIDELMDEDFAIWARFRAGPPPRS